MSYAEEIMRSLLLVLEAPDAKKGYTEMGKCYERHNKELELSAIKHLLEVRFGEIEDSDLGKE